jgi:hypothetical protein
MELKRLIAELKAEGRIIEAKGKRLRIHPGILEPPRGAPPATGGAAQVGCAWDRRQFTRILTEKPHLK